MMAIMSRLINTMLVFSGPGSFIARVTASISFLMYHMRAKGKRLEHMDNRILRPVHPGEDLRIKDNVLKNNLDWSFMMMKIHKYMGKWKNGLMGYWGVGVCGCVGVDK